MRHAGTKRKTASTKNSEVAELPAEFFKTAVMGKYARQLKVQSNVVRIAPDVSRAFPNEASVNQALRELLKIQHTLVSLTTEKSKQIPRRKKSA